MSINTHFTSATPTHKTPAVDTRSVTTSVSPQGPTLPRVRPPHPPPVEDTTPSPLTTLVLSQTRNRTPATPRYSLPSPSLFSVQNEDFRGRPTDSYSRLNLPSTTSLTRIGRRHRYPVRRQETLLPSTPPEGPEIGLVDSPPCNVSTPISYFRGPGRLRSGGPPHGLPNRPRHVSRHKSRAQVVIKTDGPYHWGEDHDFRQLTQRTRLRRLP